MSPIFDILPSVAESDSCAGTADTKNDGRSEHGVGVYSFHYCLQGLSVGLKQMKLVDGKHAMQLTGMKPGPKLGELITRVTAWIMDNNIEDKDEIDKKIIEVGRNV